MENQQLKNVLAKYIPAEAVEICAYTVVHLNIHLRITKSRGSKYGDYRPHPDKNGHIITVNHDLNQYAFLLTFIHEVAHLLCQKKYSRFAAPHGKEWKHEFAVLLKFFLSKEIFPNDIRAALHNYMQNPAASSCTDEQLYRVLKKYNSQTEFIHLEELPQDAVFRLHSQSRQLTFRKGERMRKNFRCFEVASSKEYWISPLAEVIIVESPYSE